MLPEDPTSDEASAALDAEIAELAASIGVDGTPSFVIGDLLIVGAIDEASFLGLLTATGQP